MTTTFASTEWADALHARLQESARVRTDSVTWVFGPLLFVVEADAEHGLDATAIRIDLHEGSVSQVSIVDPNELARVPFGVVGTPARWKAVFDGTQSLIDGVLESRLLVRGDLPTLTRHRSLLDAIAAAGGELETTWPHEQEPAAAQA